MGTVSRCERQCDWTGADGGDAGTAGQRRSREQGFFASRRGSRCYRGQERSGERGGPLNSRCCSRTACKQPPVYTLTYVYKDSTAVLGPLAGYVDPHSWDVCEMHAARLVVPRGWDVVRLPPDPAQERADDLEALANIVRDVGRAERASAQARPAAPLRQGGAPPGAGGGAAAAPGRRGTRGPGRRDRPPRSPARRPVRPRSRPAGRGLSQAFSVRPAP